MADVAPAAPVAPVAPAAAAKPPTGAPAASTPDATVETKYAVKIDGETRQLTMAEIQRLASKSGFADKTVRQAKEALAAAKKREAELAEREGIWDDDERLEAELAKRGKLDKLAAKRLQAKLNEQEMTPEQKRIAELEADRDAKDKRLKEVDDKEKQGKISEAAKRIQANFHGTLAKVAEAAGFPKDADSFSALHEVTREFAQLGLIDLRNFTATDAGHIVEAAQAKIDESFQRLESNVLKGLKGEALVKRLGPETVKELLRWKVNQIRNPTAAPAGAAPVAAKPAEQKYESPADFQRRMRGE